MVLNPSRGASPVLPGASPVRRGASPVRSGASPVRSGDDRSPSPLPRTSHGRMQTPSAAANLKKSAAKSDSPPRGRTMTRSAKFLLLPRLLLTISHLMQNIPTLSGHQVFLVDTAIRTLISLRRDWFVPAPETKVSNTTLADCGSGDVGGLRRSERISSSAQRVEPSARGVQVKPRERSAARSGESSGESSRLITPPTPGRSWDSPDEVLSQAISHLERKSERNSELYPRGDSPSPTNEDDVVTAGEGQAPFHRRKCREESCVCTWVKGPNGVFTNTRSRSSSRTLEAARNGSEMKKAKDTRMRSRSSSRAPEARNGSDSSKAKTKEAKDTQKSSKPSAASDDCEPRGKGLGQVPIFFVIIYFALMSFPASFAITETKWLL